MSTKVAICTPTLAGPLQPYVDSLEASARDLPAAGFEIIHCLEVGNPYISGARASLMRRALNAKADRIVYIDHDVSWRPIDLLNLLICNHDVVAGLYRFKKPNEPEEYMGVLEATDDGKPVVKGGLLMAEKVPAGFLALTPRSVEIFMQAYPELVFGPRYQPSVDLFNHGAIENVWFGEDYAFSYRWRKAGGQIYVRPDLQLDHWSGDTPYPGNYHEFLRRRPGGDLSDG